MQLIARLADTVKTNDQPYLPPCSLDAVQEAEQELQLKFPALLVACLTRVGNGGFGPGYGLIGIQGSQSDLGDIVNTCAQLKHHRECAGKRWGQNLLPFCTWGCNVFACVDCDTTEVWILRGEGENELEKTSMSLDEFLSRWLDGASGSELLETSRFTKKSIVLKDPVTGTEIEVFSGP